MYAKERRKNNILNTVNITTSKHKFFKYISNIHNIFPPVYILPDQLVVRLPFSALKTYRYYSKSKRESRKLVVFFIFLNRQFLYT